MRTHITSKEKLALVRSKIARWQMKATRAHNALVKLRKQEKLLDKLATVVNDIKKVPLPLLGDVMKEASVDVMEMPTFLKRTPDQASVADQAAAQEIKAEIDAA